MRRLGAAMIDHLPGFVNRPGYARDERGIGIVHLGLGAFARAHLAEYTDDAMAADGDWRIAGISMRSSGVSDALGPQQELYTRVARDETGADYRLIGSVGEVVVAPEQPARLAALLVAPATRIVSLTITEAGYGQNAATGELDLNNQDIVHDLRGDGEPPRSALGMIAAGLAARHVAGLEPFTVMSCDNLAGNGTRLRSLLLAFMRASAAREHLADWVEAHGAFPSTMVDRIVPATPREELEATASALGFRDAAAVVTEPFKQWVVEDRFVAGRPAWELGGATLVADVAPFERAKLRMLNASHSALAYLGLLAGLATVDEAIGTPLRGFIERFMRDEAAPALQPSPLDLTQYGRTLRSRFANPALGHRLAQIAADGSQKLPQRVLTTLRENRLAGRSTNGACLILAGFIQHMSGVDLNGQSIAVNDPLAGRFAKAATDHAPEALIPASLAIGEVFGRDLLDNQALVADLIKTMHQLRTEGVMASI